MPPPASSKRETSRRFPGRRVPAATAPAYGLPDMSGQASSHRRSGPSVAASLEPVRSGRPAAHRKKGKAAAGAGAALLPRPNSPWRRCCPPLQPGLSRERWAGGHSARRAGLGAAGLQTEGRPGAEGGTGRDGRDSGLRNAPGGEAAPSARQPRLRPAPSREEKRHAGVWPAGLRERPELLGGELLPHLRCLGRGPGSLSATLPAWAEAGGRDLLSGALLGRAARQLLAGVCVCVCV